MGQGDRVNRPKVSVVIPVYNTEAYVEEAVQSIMNQTLKDIEIIIIEDGSTDNSLSVIKKLALEDDRIQYFSQPNQGQSVARNIGIDKAAGEYIYFMDSDDILEEEALMRCFVKAEKDQLDFVLFNASILNKENDFNVSIDYKQPVLNENSIYSGESMLSTMLTQRSYRCSPCIHFISAELIELYHLRFYPGIIHEDELFSAQLYIEAQRAGYINTAFFKRRLRADSVMTKQYSMKNVNCYLVVSEQLLNFTKYKNIQEKILIDRLLSYILDPNIYRANILSFRERKNIFLKCIRKKLTKYVSLKTFIVLIFPWTIKIKRLLMNKPEG
ncbi:MAG: glycosyltransferase [Proteiniphilum sp.]|uniref:glycosyltransferase n=1 Tax=Proteiniphilum sp. TaxID=1926877 RepID=UPI002B2122D3|nr:glycosyltransferase [Proteiniphilum sp.]MEA5129460.1 glycosyltransferase [Proteiniphilum sp.]